MYYIYFERIVILEEVFNLLEYCILQIIIFLQIKINFVLFIIVDLVFSIVFDIKGCFKVYLLNECF